MICPSCRAEMTEETHNGVRLDLCRSCHGAWFDWGELEAYNHSGESDGLEGVPGPGERFMHTGESAHVRCPRCESDILRTGRISRYHVMRCTSCGGLFLPLRAQDSDRREESGLLESAVRTLEAMFSSVFEHREDPRR